MMVTDPNNPQFKIERYDFIILGNNLGMIVTVDDYNDRIRVWLFNDDAFTFKIVYGERVKDLVIKNPREENERRRNYLWKKRP